MKKNMQTATTLTIVATFLYCIYLLTVGHFHDLPKETMLVVFSKQWMLESPFELSPWWNLWVFPAILLVVAYCYNSENIIGKEPRGDNNNIRSKYNARSWTHSLSAICLIFGVWMPLVSGMFQPFTMEMMGGPLSGLLMGVWTYVIAYVVLGAGVEMLVMLFKEISLTDQPTGDMYTERFVSYAKLGVVKTLPFLLGLSLGFMFRFMYEGIINVIQRICKGVRVALT